jgi:hypothetical protein
MEKKSRAAADLREASPAGDPPRCDHCDRLLRDAAEGLRSARRTLCPDCYESLIDPFPKRCHAGLLL